MSARESFNNIKAVFKRETQGYFGSPVAYVFIVIFLILIGFFTFNISRFYEAGQADLRGFFEWHPWLFMFLIPAISMRLWAEEMRMGTIELVLTLPVTAGEVILGKFLAAWFFIGVALFLTFPMVLTTIYLGNPDLGVVFTAYFGSFLLAGGFLSVGLMTSSLTRSQVISFIIAIVFCLFFILAGFQPVTRFLTGWAPAWLINIFAEISFLTHYMSIQRGILDLRDILFYFSVMGFMLFVNAIIIQNRKTA